MLELKLICVSRKGSLVRSSLDFPNMIVSLRNYCKNAHKASEYIHHHLKDWESQNHDDVIKWKYFLRYWPFVRGIHRSPVNSPHKGQWRGALMFSMICAWINSWVNTRKAGNLRRHRGHYDVSVIMACTSRCWIIACSCRLCAFWYSLSKGV